MPLAGATVPELGKRVRVMAKSVVLAALGLLFVFFVADQFIIPPTLEALIRDYNFEPLKPPTRDREPGTLYVVQGNNLYTKVCQPSADALATIPILWSPASKFTLWQLSQAGFSLAGGWRVKLGGSRNVLVTYELRDAMIWEGTEENLLKLQRRMVAGDCDKVVRSWLSEGKKVCPAIGLLRATASYKINAQDDATLSAAQQTIVQHAEGGAEFKTKHEAEGKDLFYGIRLSSLCLIPGDATSPVLREQPSTSDTQRLSAKP